MSGIDEKPRSSSVRDAKMRKAIQEWLDYFERHIKWMFEPDPFRLAAKDLMEQILNERDRGETG